MNVQLKIAAWLAGAAVTSALTMFVVAITSVLLDYPNGGTKAVVVAALCFAMMALLTIVFFVWGAILSESETHS